MARLAPLFGWLVSLVIVAGLLVAGWFTRETWTAWLLPPAAATNPEEHGHAHDAQRLKLSPQAWENLKLRTGAITVTHTWRTVQMPGTVVERPGRSSRGVASTLAGVVSHIHAIPGQVVKPNETLFLRIVSEYLQNAQAQLYKTTRELEINTEEQKRLRDISRGEELFRNRLLELGYEERRLRAAVDTHRQDLLSRGLAETELQQVIKGQFVTEMTVRVPRPTEAPATYELEELKVQAGESVQPGQVLAYLASHEALDVEGKAFEQEAPLLHKVTQEGVPLEITVLDVAPPGSAETVRAPIRFVSNHVDPATRMLSFYLPLENSSREMPSPLGVRRIWRFRPGQRVRLAVPVERIENGFLVPRDAVVREGPDAYVFRVNGNVLERKAVHVRHEDQFEILLANDGSVTQGNVLALNAAAALNRALKAQAEGDAGGHHHDHDH